MSQSVGTNRISHLLNHLQSPIATNTSLLSASNASTLSKMASNLTFVLITGCSRGIGYGLTEYFLQNRANYYVIATCRSPEKADKLKLLISKYKGRSSLIKLNVTSQKSVEESFETISKITDRIDILINNAGIMHHFENVLNVNEDEMNMILQTNVIGPALMFKTFHKLLAKNKDNNNNISKVINISSQLGSLKYAKWNNKINRVPATTYRISKSALNMLTRCQAFQVGEKHNIIITTICPGQVDTDLGTAKQMFPAAIKLNDSCKVIVQFIEQMDFKTHNGQFYAYKNKKGFEQSPW